MRFNFLLIGILAVAILLSCMGCSFSSKGINIYNLKEESNVLIRHGEFWKTLIRNYPSKKQFYTIERFDNNEFRLILRDYSGSLVNEKKFFWEKIYYVMRQTFDFSPGMKQIVAYNEEYKDIRLTDFESGEEKILIPKVSPVAVKIIFIDSKQFILAVNKNEGCFGGKRGKLIKYNILNNQISKFNIPPEYKWNAISNFVLSPSNRLMAVVFGLNCPIFLYDTETCKLLKISESPTQYGPLLKTGKIPTPSYSIFCFNEKEDEIIIKDGKYISVLNIDTLDFTQIFAIPEEECLYQVEYQDHDTIVILSGIPGEQKVFFRFIDIKSKKLLFSLKRHRAGRFYVTNNYLIYEDL